MRCGSTRAPVGLLAPERADGTRVEPYEVWRHHMVPPGFLNERIMSPIYLPLAYRHMYLSSKYADTVQVYENVAGTAALDKFLKENPPEKILSR
eukprot:SAG22_NODE_161_length_16908_cov_39.687965_23_plen_94_part_00